MTVQNTSSIPPSIQKQLPQAVLRKALEMDEVGHLDFVEEFRKRKRQDARSAKEDGEFFWLSAYIRMPMISPSELGVLGVLAVQLWQHCTGSPRPFESLKNLITMSIYKPDSHEEKKLLETELLKQLKTRLPELEALLEKSDSHWHSEDMFYRFYHQSFKVYYLQADTETIVAALRDLLPGRELNEDFMRIVDGGTGRKFEPEHNQRWQEETRPILEAFFHARMMLQLAVQYAGKLDSPPSMLPSGWAAVLYLYRLR